MAEKEYIERKALVEEIRKAQRRLESCDDIKWERNKPYFKGLAWAHRIVLDAPAADVVEVKHGEWIPSPDGINPIKCRRCGTVAPYRMELDFSHDIGLYPYKSNYCPHCGAKMDGERKEQDNV